MAKYIYLLTYWQINSVKEKQLDKRVNVVLQPNPSFDYDLTEVWINEDFNNGFPNPVSFIIYWKDFFLLIYSEISKIFVYSNCCIRTRPETYSEPSRISKMDFFTIKVNGF